MALVTIHPGNQTLTEDEAIRSCLKKYGIDYERWPLTRGLPVDVSAEEVLDAYATEIDELKSSGVSLMPEGLERQIPPPDMADLLSFIKNWRYLDGRTPLSQ